jgi:hypothetical protein
MITNHLFINDLQDLIYNKQCLITGKEFTVNDCKDRNIILLDCKHAFLYKPFMVSYYNLNTNLLTYRKCPYCMKTISKIPYKINKKLFRD